MKLILNTIILIALSLIVISCKKDKTAEPEPAPLPQNPTAGSLKIEFEGMVDTNDLVLSTQTYTNQLGNTFNVTVYKYYISNVKITNVDNSVWAESNSYHLIDYSNPSSTIVELANVPFGKYKAIEFMIGIDSARNVSGAQTGALDVSNGMFWSWNQGYIMAKMEGTSPQSTATNNKLMFHIGGFSGNNNTLKIVSPSFNGDTAKVSSTVTPMIHMKNDLLEFFQAPNAINFSTLNTIHMPGAMAKSMSDNYADMFSVEHIHND